MDVGAIEEIDVEAVKKRSLVGVLSLVSRSFLVQAISQASFFLLTIFLDPKTFGVYYLVSALINFFNYFSDIGLAAALIQKKEKLSEDDLKTTFFVQETLVILLIVIIFFLSPLLSKSFGLDKASLYLFYSLVISFFLSSLKTIPSVLLERQLKFSLLIVPQILENLVFSLITVFLAWQGLGIASFTWAVLARSIVGLVTMYLISPWKPEISFSKSVLKNLLKFGVPYQANTIIAVVKDDLMTIFLGKIIGTTGLGYLGWAKKWAEQPLRFFMDNVSKVVFPAFSRLQDDENKLKSSVEKTVFYLCFLTFPILVGFSVLASDLVKIIPRYLKWQPALIPLYLYCFNSAWATISTSMTNLLNAIGKIKTTSKLMVMWLTLTWIFMPILALKFDYVGVALATAIISLSSVAAIIAVKRKINFNLSNSIFKPLISSVLMGVAIFFIKFQFGSLPISVLSRVLLGLFFYLLISYLIIGKSLFVEMKQISYEIRKKH